MTASLCLKCALEAFGSSEVERLEVVPPLLSLGAAKSIFSMLQSSVGSQDFLFPTVVQNLNKGSSVQQTPEKVAAHTEADTLEQASTQLATGPGRPSKRSKKNVKHSTSAVKGALRTTASSQHDK